MAYKIGKNCKVTLGSATVVGMGTWSMDGVSADQIETTAFGDNWKSFEFGAKDGGTLSFNGLYDPADVTGQEVLAQANLSNTDITNIRLYVDNTSYYEPCRTTGYFSPTLSTGASTVLSNVNIISYSVSADKGDALKINFSAKVSGCMVLV